MGTELCYGRGGVNSSDDDDEGQVNGDGTNSVGIKSLELKRSMAFFGFPIF